MKKPEFTDLERFMIDGVRLSSFNTETSPHLIGFLLFGLILAVFGVLQNNIWAVLIAFSIIFGFRIFEIFYHLKYQTIWKSIIDKYEDTLNPPAIPNENNWLKSPSETEESSA